MQFKHNLKNTIHTPRIILIYGYFLGYSRTLSDKN